MTLHRGPETRLVRFKQILVVDQDEAWALVMRDAVARGGFCVVLATSLDEAIRQMREQAPDLVLVSCLLDGEAGETLLREIDALNVAPPVVLVGLHEADRRWDPWRERRFVSVVRQPFKSQDVLTAVRTLLDTSWEDRAGDGGSRPTPGAPGELPKTGSESVDLGNRP